MKSFTAYRDHLPKGQSYPIGLSSINSMVPDKCLAVYFISTATWVRQVYPLKGDELPVIRVQLTKPILRVRNEKVKNSDNVVDYHILIYTVPSNMLTAVSEKVKAVTKDWPEAMKENQIIFYSEHGARTEQTLPSWI